MSKTSELLEIHALIKSASINLDIRNKSKLLREDLITEYQPLKKLAFDTRRIDQDKEYNPRRGLQHYHRSEEFVTEETLNKVNSIKKLKNITALLKDLFHNDDSWHDSFAKTLYNSLENTINDFNKLGNFSQDQKSLTGLNYIQQLLTIRYGINLDNVQLSKDEDILNVILNRDDELLKKFNALNLKSIKFGIDDSNTLQTLSKVQEKEMIKEIPITLKSQPTKQEIRKYSISFTN